MIAKSRLKNMLALRYKKFRDEQNLFLIEGYRLCQEALQSDFKVETLLIHSDSLSPQNLNEITKLAQYQQVEIFEIQQSEVKRLAETVNSQGVFCIVQQKKIELDTVLNKDNQLIVIISEGQDPGNVGTIIRTCDWFGITAIFLSKRTVELYNPKVIRSTMGSIFHVQIVEQVELDNLLPRLSQMGYHIFGTDVNGQYNYNQTNYPRPLALVIGNENKGINNNLFKYFDRTIKIPSYGKAESLNMAIATSIIISRAIN